MERSILQQIGNIVSEEDEELVIDVSEYNVEALEKPFVILTKPGEVKPVALAVPIVLFEQWEKS